MSESGRSVPQPFAEKQIEDLLAHPRGGIHITVSCQSCIVDCIYVAGHGTMILRTYQRLSKRNGKPAERLGRKAKGPHGYALAAWLPKGESSI